MEDNIPKISVLMPVYNEKEEYLRIAIESILNQTYKDFELIIINDGSTNNVEDVILSYNDTRIKYIKNEKNLKLVKTLNKGIDLARGEYIARMDSDDESLPERFEKQVEFLDEHKEIGLCGTYYEVTNKGFDKFPTEDLDIKIALFNDCVIGHPTVMLRSELIKNNKYDENFEYTEDYALWCKIASQTKFVNIPEVLLNYRWHGNNTCAKKKNVQKKKQKLIKDLYRKNNPEIYEEYKKRFIKEIKLLNFIPFIKIEDKVYEKKVRLFNTFVLMRISHKENYDKYSLFNFIPIFKKKRGGNV